MPGPVFRCPVPGVGIVRAIGVSNFEPDRLLDLIAYNQTVPAVDQIETNLYCQRSAERSWMDKKQVAHMAYAPLGQANAAKCFLSLRCLRWRKNTARLRRRSCSAF